MSPSMNSELRAAPRRRWRRVLADARAVLVVGHPEAAVGRHRQVERFSVFAQRALRGDRRARFGVQALQAVGVYERGRGRHVVERVGLAAGADPDRDRAFEFAFGFALFALGPQQFPARGAAVVLLDPPVAVVGDVEVAGFAAAGVVDRDVGRAAEAAGGRGRDPLAAKRGVGFCFGARRPAGLQFGGPVSHPPAQRLDELAVFAEDLRPGCWRRSAT